MKSVIFDVGRVLIQWDIYPLFLDLLDNQANIDKFIKDVDFFKWNTDLDEGQSFSSHIAAYSAKFPHYADVFQQFDKRWPETIPGSIDKSVDILNALKQNNVPLYAITNFSHEKWPIACQMFPYLANSFIDTIVSGEVKMIKPNPEIFQLLLDRNSLKAEDCIFIDDTKVNVDAAIKLGIDGLLFTSAEQFEQDLIERGVL